MTTHPVPRHRRPTALKKFLFGVPYYPEHWTHEDRRDDARRMAEAGVTIVRMGEFAWDRMEPQRDLFDFSLFDETLGELGKVGISAMMCTPTAAPPRWLTDGHDDWMRVDAMGRRMVHGSRQHCCTNNPGFREQSQRITRVMAKHYAGNPHVIGWQTDNEFFCHISECYCDACVAKFRTWLRRQYVTVDALNQAWGTAFWALTYTTFEQVPLPYIPERPTYANPGHLLDYYRFLSDSLAEFQREQIAILREANPHWWVTHNGMMGHIDYWEFTKDLDFLGIDVYPGFSARGPERAYDGAVALERCRAATGGFIVPEQQTGAGGQRPYLHETPRPGQMRLWAYQSIAHGADGILHFRWRSCRFGAEIYWNGILDHDNLRRRRFDEFATEGRELGRIGAQIVGSVVDVKIGVLVEQDQDEAHAAIHLGLPGPRDCATTLLAELMRRHLPAGFVDAEDDFEGLDIVVVPSMRIVDPEFAARVRAFVERGGTVVATARTATRDRNNRVLPTTPPGHMNDLFGLTVEEFGKLDSPLLALQAGDLAIPAGGAYEMLFLGSALPLAVWGPAVDGGPHAAALKPAVALNAFGAGKAIYVGTFLNDQNVHALVELILNQTGVAPLAQADEFVEVTRRSSATAALCFVLNHYPERKTARGLPHGAELLRGLTCDGVVELEPYGVAIVKIS